MIVCSSTRILADSMEATKYHTSSSETYGTAGKLVGCKEALKAASLMCAKQKDYFYKKLSISIFADTLFVSTTQWETSMVGFTKVGRKQHLSTL